MKRLGIGVTVGVLALGVLSWGGLEASAEDDPEQLVFFDSKVHPLLEKHCYKCHGGRERLKSGLRLTSRAGLLEGGDRGPAVNPSDPKSSLLLEMVSYKDGDHEMPPDGKLPDEAIGILRQWVEMGVPYNPAREISGKAESHASPYDNEINEKTRNYWAFRPIGDPQPPEVDDAEWAKNPIDAYIYDSLAEKGLKPNPPAPRRQLIRRAYYDLIGLPPSLEEVEAFVRDSDPNAFEQVVDRLLASPQYGEKWGRHWLDLVRYAETDGYERDNPKPEVWRYRDYVVRSLNEDKPYDRFVKEQIAGDELPDADAESIIATGFQRLGLWDDEPADPEQAYFDSLDDVVGTTAQVFLGLTLNCARCHDHKIDPVPQEDYYRFLAFFNNTFKNIKQKKYEKTAFTLNTTTVIASEKQRREHERRVRELKQELDELTGKIGGFEKRIEATFSKPEKEDAEDDKTREVLLKQKAKDALAGAELREYRRLKREFAKLKERKAPPLPSALSIRENGREAPETYVLIRGNAHVKGGKVEPGFPQVLGFGDPEIPELPSGVQSSGRRLALANWIAGPDNPLTARVIANRLWQFHFGRGIVRSSNNFGQNGDAPTHPELLRWLAADLIKKGWSLKAMHKQIMLSKAFQMSSAARSDGLGIDPNNNLFWRFDMRRLTAEEIRDSIVKLTGKLNLKMGGPSIYTEMPPAVLATASRPDSAWGRSPEAERHRRGIYIHVKRSLAEPFLKAHDQADTDSSCAVRFATTVPTQSLTMLNSRFINDQAEVLAHRLIREAGDSPEAQVKLGLELALSRPPSAEEIRTGAEMIGEFRKEFDLNANRALQRFCLMVLNLNEFVYLD